MRIKQGVIVQFTVIAALALTTTLSAKARPRPPLPPFPEFGVLNAWRFDGSSIGDPSDSAPLATQGVELVEGWSGYALKVEGSKTALARFPAFQSDARRNLRCDVGTVRFWFWPAWSSADRGGTGPGSFGRLIEVGVPSEKGTGWWSLYFDPTGSTIHFSAQAGGVSMDYLEAPISWQAGEWHQITLVYGEPFSALEIDGQWAAQGAGVSVWPDDDLLAQSGFYLGSDSKGTSLAQGQFDELYTFNHPCTSQESAFYYRATAPAAKLGPITAEEDAARKEAAAKRLAEQEASGGSGGSTMMMQPSTSCDTNGPVRLTNVVCAFTTNDGWTIAFDIMGGTNGLAYDVFTTSSLIGGNITNSVWTWLERGPACYTYIYTNQPSTHAFYVVGTLLDSDFDGLSDAFERLIFRTNPLLYDTDGDGISDALEDHDGDGLPNYVAATRNAAICVYATQPTATEGGAGGQFRIVLPQAAPAGGVTVQYMLTGSALLNDEYQLSPAPFGISIPAGGTQAVINVTAVNDAIGDELDRTVELRITNATHFAWDERPAEVALINNDPPNVRMIVTDAEAAERGGGTNRGEFLFVRDAGFNQALTIFFTAGGTASGGSDYTGIGGSIAIPTGERSATLLITPAQDAVVEGSETVTVTLSGNAAYGIDPTGNTATVIIVDDDLPTVEVTAIDSDARESGANIGQFQFTRTGSTGVPLTINFAAYGTAAPSNYVYGTSNIVQDYQPLPTNAVIAAGASSVTVSVTPLADSQLETMETVVATLRGSTEYKIGANNSATVFIDDSNAAQFTHEIVKASAAAGGSIDVPAEVIIRRLGTSRTAQNLGWALSTADNVFLATNTTPNPFTADGTNVTWNNFAHTNGQLQFGVNVWEVKVNIHAGLFGRPNGVYFVVTNVVNAVSVFYFDQKRLFSLSILERVAIEGGQLARVRVSRPLANSSAFLDQFQLVITGTALPDFGYDLFNNRPIYNFPQNQTTMDITLSVPTDAPNEGWENLYIDIDPQQQLAVPDNRSGTAARVLLFARDATQFTPQPMIDTDQDGLWDGYESANGLNPQLPDDPYADPDRDGLNHLEEQAAGASPNDTDSDNDGHEDFIEYLSDWRSLTNVTAFTPSLDNSVPVRLRVTSCFKCHATGMQVGEFSLFNSPPGRPVAEDIVRLTKGRSYPARVFAAHDPFSPTNSQLYTAQVLPASTPTGFLIEDSDGILGTNKLITSNLTTKTAWVHVPRLELGVDADRDSVIRFLPNTSDQTSAAKPYTFWINDDSDNGSDDSASDILLGTPDSADTTIANLRDLEDFTRLHLRLDAVSTAQLQSGSLTVALEWRSAFSDPRLRLYQSAATNGSLSYQTNETAANAQLGGSFGTSLGWVTIPSSLTLPTTVWSGVAGSNVFRPFLFEGYSSGEGQLVAVLKQGGVPVAESAPVFIRLRPVTNLFEHYTLGDNTTTEWNAVPLIYSRAGDSGTYSTNAVETQDYIVFVHGWRMEPPERRSFGTTAFKRLYWAGYRGRYGIFSWPTDFTTISFWNMLETVNRQNYDRSERRAWNSGYGLRRLLKDLNNRHPGRVRLFSHSMGGIVAGEALRLHGSRAGAVPVVQSYIACQSAAVAHAFDAVGPQVVLPFAFNPEIYASYPRGNTPQRYFNGMANAVSLDPVSLLRRTWNYHNFQDFALTAVIAWPVNQTLKPDVGWKYYPIPGAWTRDNLLRTRLQLPGDTYEIFAHMATARSKALGAAEDPTHLVRGEIGNAFDLNSSTTGFGFKAETYEHSAQFNSIIARRLPFWRQMMSNMSLTNAP